MWLTGIASLHPSYELHREQPAERLWAVAIKAAEKWQALAG
jgi:hypothetical protein